MVLARRAPWDPHFVDRSPWLWPIARAAAHLASCTAFPTHAELDALYAAVALAERPGAPRLSFRPDVRDGARAGSGTARTRRIEDCYDGRIALRGEVPTRAEHWHDLLNALCFATFPRSKYALHTRQCAALARRGGPQSTRTREQDALTLFDEGGVVIAAPAASAAGLRAALAAGELARLDAVHCAGGARVVPFGHALFEHMVEGAPCPGASARVIALEPLPESRDALVAAVDDALAARIADAGQFWSPAEAAHVRLL